MYNASSLVFIIHARIQRSGQRTGSPIMRIQFYLQRAELAGGVVLTFDLCICLAKNGRHSGSGPLCADIAA